MFSSLAPSTCTGVHAIAPVGFEHPFVRAQFPGVKAGVTEVLPGFVRLPFVKLSFR